MPNLTCMRELPPPGAGDPTKLWLWQKHFGRLLTPVPWIALAPHMANTMTSCYLWPVWRSNSGDDHWCRKWRRASVTPENLHHRHLLGIACPLCLLSQSNTFVRWVASWAKAGCSWAIRDHQWCREKAPCGLLGEQNFRKKSSARNSMCICHLPADVGHGRLHGRITSSTQIRVMKQCKQEQGLVTCSSLIPFCFYRCAVHGN